MGCDAGGIVRADRRTLISFVQRLGHKGLDIWPQRYARKAGQFLPDLGSANLEHCAEFERRRAASGIGKDTQICGLHVLQIDFDPRDTCEIGRAPSELQSLMRISYAVFCLKNTKNPSNPRA